MTMEILIASMVVLLGILMVFVFPKKVEKNNTQTTPNGGHTSHPSTGGESGRDDVKPEHGDITYEVDDPQPKNDEMCDMLL